MRSSRLTVALAVLLALAGALSAEMSWNRATDSAAWYPRYSLAATAFDGKLWVLGGGEYPRTFHDVWYSEDGVDWTRATAAAAWSSRYYHATVVFDGRMWVIGGRDTSSVFMNDIWSSSDGDSWVLVTDSAPWPARRGHAALVLDTTLWIVGGGSSELYNDAWYSFNGADWEEATDSAPWPGRSSFASAVFDGKLWVMGGYDGSHYRNDVWWSDDGAEWTEATDSAPWSARAGHSAVAFDGKLWVLGGYPHVDDVWYTEDGEDWTRATDSAGWSGRYGHASVVLDSTVWLLGGCDSRCRRDVWYWESPLTARHLVGRLATAEPSVPMRLVSFLGNMPTVFRSGLSLTYDLARPAAAKVTVCGSMGDEVSVLASGTRGAGRHVVTWNGRSESGRELPAGVYFIVAEADRDRAVLKVAKLP